MKASWQFPTIFTILLASSAFVAAAPGPNPETPQVFGRDPSEIFKLEKRCQGNGQYCDGVAIRCCAGSCCTDRHGAVRYCEPCN
ncbi:hypothetical protein BS50DRAFT_640448 [Corynespora cassiicola Philippines]|uniref:Uncharacterized protein n=1 Tax=Corynespora cassiicola Philippines TaxID=1448308 RepID=A0A2T2N3J8_CORCC|nr:hypothetical protein BS50DRAFT_640448 [Corynespora cassiicola Philippines]